ncbi:MAG: hypothetical protein JKX74_04030, partial [Flavobacteriales bacterium]|nr:hypothetical protein [Flavobacteriales bacterium]
MSKRIKYWVLPTLVLQGLLLTITNSSFAGGTCCGTCVFSTTSVTLASTTGCNLTTYTFTQKTPNKDDASITANTTRGCTIDFPAGTDATTATVAGSTMDGVAIGSFSTQTATQLIFTIPPGVAIAINTQFLIVIADVTNGDGLTSNCSVTANGDVCDITGINAYALTTTACPGTCSDAILNQDETGPADCGGVCGGDATANAGADATVCNSVTHTLSGATIGGTATTQTWITSGDGTYSSTTALNPTYTPGTSDITSGTVTLTITTDDPAGVCLAASDAMILTIEGCGACNVAAGDIAITGFNADNLPDDQFSIVVLTTLAAGEEIFFTDNGWLAAGGFRTGEGVLTWTVPGGGLTCGTEVTFTNNAPWTVTAGTVSLTGSFLLNVTGESIIAYTGTLNCPTNLFAINDVAGGGWDADATDAQTSALPSGLVDGNTAIALVHIDNSKYDCSTSTGSAAVLRAAIANNANWAGDNSAQVSLPPTCTFSCTCPEPVTAPDAPTFANITTTSFDINWANGGPNYLVVIKSGSAVTNNPTDGSTYTANTIFGSGSDLGGGEYVVYDGIGTTVSVTGLTCGTTYHIEIFSHDCTPQNYKIDVGGVSSQATSSEPGTAPDVPTFANLAAVSFDINWANGGPNYLVVVKSGSAVLNNPVDGTTYTASTTFGSGSDLGGGEYVVYDGTGTTVSIAGLLCGTTYHIEIFSYACSPKDYKTDAGGVGNQATTVCGASRWSLGAAGTIVRTRATSSDIWQNQYDGGIATIPATAFWILRETASTGAPTISSTNGGGPYYPNLIIESINGAWITTGTASAFSGSTAYPTIKGNLDIGGAGGGAVTFENSNTNATRTSVLGDVIVRSGHTLQNNGSGFDIQGDLNIIGTITYDADGGRGLEFSGGNAQSILGAGTLNIYDMFINKSADKVTLNRVITVDN